MDSLSEALQRLPLFPLPDVVLFPHALLPLHIFEPRYRAMTRDVLAGAKVMAMGMIVPGQDQHAENPAVQRIAGAGEVVISDELPDGRFHLVLRGWSRIRIDEELASDLPYRLVRATALPDLPPGDPAELTDADQSLRALFTQLADVLPRGSDLLHLVASQHTPAELVDVLAAMLIADPALRQQLLETRDVARRIERVSAEVVAMTARFASGGPVN